MTLLVLVALLGLVAAGVFLGLLALRLQSRARSGGSEVTSQDTAPASGGDEHTFPALPAGPEPQKPAAPAKPVPEICYVSAEGPRRAARGPRVPPAAPRPLARPPARTTPPRCCTLTSSKPLPPLLHAPRCTVKPSAPSTRPAAPFAPRSLGPPRPASATTRPLPPPSPPVCMRSACAVATAARS